MILIHGECNKHASDVRHGFMQTINIFLKTSFFSQFHLTKANDVYLKIYETAQLCLMFS
jgi:hypothetical protein